MMKAKDNSSDQEIVQLLIQSLPGLIALYRFGSHGKATAHSDSDLDVAILPSAPLSAVRRFEIEQGIAAIVHGDVDLVDLHAASTVMRMQVISTGECLYRGDERECDKFETYVFSSYARLNEERREILKEILERGRVYG